MEDKKVCEGCILADIYKCCTAVCELACSKVPELAAELSKD